jgi:hypothetical protein
MKKFPQTITGGPNNNQQSQFELALRSNQDVDIIESYLSQDSSLAENKIHTRTNYNVRDKNIVNLTNDGTYYYLQCYLWFCREFEFDLDNTYALYVNNIKNVTQLLYSKFKDAGTSRTLDSGMNCLHMAIMANRHVRIIAMVHDWDPTMLTENTTDRGHTPLHYAIRNRNETMIKYLIQLDTTDTLWRRNPFQKTCPAYEAMLEYLSIDVIKLLTPRTLMFQRNIWGGGGKWGISNVLEYITKKDIKNKYQDEISSYERYFENFYYNHYDSRSIGNYICAGASSGPA